MIYLMSDPEMFRTCYKPQIRMNLAYNGYAINAAFVCFLLVVCIMTFDECSERSEKVVNIISDYMYFTFGPVLFIFCLFGLFNFRSISHECLPTHIGENWNLMDIIILLVCTIFSFSILFIFSL